jgi:hypothetical protein
MINPDQHPHLESAFRMRIPDADPGDRNQRIHADANPQHWVPVQAALSVCTDTPSLHQSQMIFVFQSLSVLTNHQVIQLIQSQLLFILHLSSDTSSFNRSYHSHLCQPPVEIEAGLSVGEVVDQDDSVNCTNSFSLFISEWILLHQKLINFFSSNNVNRVSVGACVAMLIYSGPISYRYLNEQFVEIQSSKSNCQNCSEETSLSELRVQLCQQKGRLTFIILKNFNGSKLNGDN